MSGWWCLHTRTKRIENKNVSVMHANVRLLYYSNKSTPQKNFPSGKMTTKKKIVKLSDSCNIGRCQVLRTASKTSLCLYTCQRYVQKISLREDQRWSSKKNSKNINSIENFCETDIITQKRTLMNVRNASETISAVSNKYLSCLDEKNPRKEILCRKREIQHRKFSGE